MSRPLGLGHTIGQSCPQKDSVPLVREWQLHLELGLAPWHYSSLERKGKNEDRLIGTADTRARTLTYSKVSSEAPRRAPLTTYWKRLRNHLFATFPFTEVRLISVVQHGLAILFDYWDVAWWQTLVNDVVSGDRKQSTMLRSRNAGAGISGRIQFSRPLQPIGDQQECLTDVIQWRGNPV